MTLCQTEALSFDESPASRMFITRTFVLFCLIHCLEWSLRCLYCPDFHCVNWSLRRLYCPSSFIVLSDPCLIFTALSLSLCWMIPVSSLRSVSFIVLIDACLALTVLSHLLCWITLDKSVQAMALLKSRPGDQRTNGIWFRMWGCRSVHWWICNAKPEIRVWNSQRE